jgi:hypothetical protein
LYAEEGDLFAGLPTKVPQKNYQSTDFDIQAVYFLYRRIYMNKIQKRPELVYLQIPYAEERRFVRIVLADYHRLPTYQNYDYPFHPSKIYSFE